MERRHGCPQPELEPALRVIVAVGPVSQDFQLAADGLRLLGGAVRTGAPSRHPSGRPAGASASCTGGRTKINTGRQYAPSAPHWAWLTASLRETLTARESCWTQVPSALGQVPLGVALLLHPVEVNIGATAERPLSRSRLEKACLTTAGTLLQPSGTTPTSTEMSPIR